MSCHYGKHDAVPMRIMRGPNSGAGVIGRRSSFPAALGRDGHGICKSQHSPRYAQAVNKFLAWCEITPCPRSPPCSSCTSPATSRSGPARDRRPDRQLAFCGSQGTAPRARASRPIGPRELSSMPRARRKSDARPNPSRADTSARDRRCALRGRISWSRPALC
jgi:hypothetical protein